VTHSRARPREAKAEKADKEQEEAATTPETPETAEKTPEQTLADKLELDRFVERLRRKFH
jgi:hypothetical protein